jgi:hypothetical protein
MSTKAYGTEAGETQRRMMWRLKFYFAVFVTRIYMLNPLALNRMAIVLAESGCMVDVLKCKGS